IALEKNEHAVMMISGLDKFLRSSLNNGNNFITLEKEIEQVSSYIQIQKLRYSDRVEMYLDIPSPLPDYKIIKLILQPLVENSIMHGFKDLNATGRITITVKETGQCLYLLVADNGWGSDIEMLNYLVRCGTLYKEDNVNFYCIQNVYLRLQNCYGDHADLTYEENADGGVTAVIRIDKEVL
ncbi:sensor histidine kinase, partial [Muricomes intestini]